MDAPEVPVTSCNIYTVKKDSEFPSPAGMSLTKLSLAGNLFLQCTVNRHTVLLQITYEYAYLQVRKYYITNLRIISNTTDGSL